MQWSKTWVDVMKKDDFKHLLRSFSFNKVSYSYYSLEDFEHDGTVQIDQLPYSIRILLESIMRKCNGKEITTRDIINIAAWNQQSVNRPVINFYPGRVLLQDLTGVPVIVDLAAFRTAIAREGKNPEKINPMIPVDLVIDHSIQVDFSGNEEALGLNTDLEYKRNLERYTFLKWAQKAFKNLRVVPPGNGIIHQINLEYLSTIILIQKMNFGNLIFPDTLIGADSHTTMINSLGVVGWGVGGIEAIAAMLGHPLEIPVPDVIGVKLSGVLPEFTTPTDLTLMITQLLRKKNVMDKFVEFIGSGLDNLNLADRATIANMAPEYGATMAYFPVDDQTLQYLQVTGRPPELIKLVEKYYKTQHLFHTQSAPIPQYSEIIELELSTVRPSLAGPKRPQDRVPLELVKSNFLQVLSTSKVGNGYGLLQKDFRRMAEIKVGDITDRLEHGSIVIAAITSCTTTSNPFSIIAAGLLAKKATEKGLKVKSYVKTSLAPGSRVVVDYLVRAGLMEPLEKLGFNLVGFGCTTCIGNSGPLPGEIARK